MPALRPAVFRARYHFSEVVRLADLAALIDRIGARGTHGLFLKAPDEPEIAAAVDRVVARGIPVVTLVTDVPNCRRAAYVGMDNRAAGETAAYLIGEWLGGAKAKILATLSSNRFRGEEEREIGFRRALRTRYPNLGIVEVSEGLGIDQPTGALVRKALAANPDIVGVYSIGGGNRAVVEAFRATARTCRVFIGHDLDADNLALLRERKISAVLHHDLRADMRAACRVVMQAHRVLPQSAPRRLPGSDHHALQSAGGLERSQSETDAAIQEQGAYVPWIVAHARNDDVGSKLLKARRQIVISTPCSGSRGIVLVRLRPCCSSTRCRGHARVAGGKDRPSAREV